MSRLLNWKTLLVVAGSVAACVAPLVMADLTFFMRTVLAAIVVTVCPCSWGMPGRPPSGRVRSWPRVP